MKIFSGSVESAGVPSGLQTLAEKISLRPDWRSGFSEAGPGGAELWLRHHCPSHLRLFLQSFGHRCLKEFELLSEPWADNLEPVTRTLQAMLSQNPVAISQAKTENCTHKSNHVLEFGKIQRKYNEKTATWKANCFKDFIAISPFLCVK